MGRQRNCSRPGHRTGSLGTHSAAQHPLAALDACKLPDSCTGHAWPGLQIMEHAGQPALVMQLPGPLSGNIRCMPWCTAGADCHCRCWASSSHSRSAFAPTTGKPVQALELPLLSSASETQHECRLVKTGPYKIVRHPAYTGAAVGYIALAMLLQLPAVVTAGGTALVAAFLGEHASVHLHAGTLLDTGLRFCLGKRLNTSWLAESCCTSYSCRLREIHVACCQLLQACA